MKKIILALFIAATTTISVAQEPDWQWARHATGIGTQETMLASSDASGNAYLAGNFQNDVTFGSTTMTQMGLGVFLAKFDQGGNLKWLRIAGGIGSNGVYLLTTDADANTYITGRYANQITFGSFTLTNTQPTIYHIFIAKYDSSGNVLWARSAGEAGNGYDMTWAVHVDKASNVYISGNIQSDTIPLDSDTLFAKGGAFCLIKYDSSGTELWSRSAPCNYFALTHYIASDSYANIYLTGYFTGDSLNFPGLTLFHQGPQAFQDIFFASYDSSGNLRWAKSYGGAGTDYGYGVTCDQADNIYLTGSFNSAPITIESVTIPNVLGQYSYYLAKFDPAGNMIWLKSDSGQSGGYCIAVDAMANLYWTGRFYSTDITIDTITKQRPALYSDPMFIARLDTSGHAYWVKVLASGGDDQNGVCLGLNGDIFIGGDYYGVNPFVVGNDSMPLTGIENGFIAKLGFNNLVALLSTTDNIICPGTCTSFINNSVNATSYQWFFPGSSTPVSSDVNPANICYPTPGQYDVTLIATNATGTDTDTLTLNNYITVYPFPPPQGILQSGDTLFANPGAVSYQWYFNGNLVAGATNFFYIAPQSGDYNVIAADLNGCEVEAAIFDVIAEIQSAVGNMQLAVFPNPVSEICTIQNSLFMFETSIYVSIYNMLGETVLAAPLSFGNGQKGEVNVSALPPAMYYLEIAAGRKVYRTKFIKSANR